MRRRGTYEDIEKLPEHLVGELIDGELIVSPRPRPRHSLASSELGAQIIPAVRRRRGDPTGGWWILDEPELHLAHGDVLVPDLAGWRRERLPVLPEEVGITVAPDWVCEVLSPSTARVDRIRKLPIYAKNGVEWCWIVDASNETIEVLRREGERWIIEGTVGGREPARLAPFAEVELDLALVWEAGG